MKRFIQARFAAWLERRMPPVEALTLSHRSIFIFPSPEGWGYGVVLALTFVGAVNYQNSLGHVLAFLLLALGHLAIHATFRNLAGVRVRLGHAQPVFVGETAEFPIVVESASGREYSALGLGFDGVAETLVDVEPGSEIVARVHQAARRRGWMRPARVYLATHYPLGLLRAWTWVAFEGACLVYPRPLPPPEMAGVGEGQAQERGRREQAGSEDYAGVRSYQPGDSLR